jgi:FkbM family methyltransferase
VTRLKACLKQRIREMKFADLKHGGSIYVGEGEIFTSTKYFNMFVPGWDLSLTPTILLRGAWETALTNYLKDRIGRGGIAIDVGANMGWFSCLFASRGARVHAFEPNPRLQRILRKNIFLNAGQRTQECAVNQCAVSDYEGSVEMRFPHWLVGGANLGDFDQQPFLDSLIPEGVPTPVVTLDAYVDRFGLGPVSILKVDIEGFEENALRGAEKTIDNSPGLLLCMEYTKGKYTRSFPEWLFEKFEQGHVPGIDRQINLQFLQHFEAGRIMPDVQQLDIVFHSGGSG